MSIYYSAESLATSETVGSETSTRYIEKYTSDLRSMATTTTEYTSESSIPAGETNDNHITSTESVKYTTVKGIIEHSSNLFKSIVITVCLALCVVDNVVPLLFKENYWTGRTTGILRVHYLYIETHK